MKNRWRVSVLTRALLAAALLLAGSPAMAQVEDEPSSAAVAPTARSAFDGEPIARPAAPQPANAQAQKPAAPMKLDMSRVGMALAIVISVIIVLTWVYRRIFGGATLQRASSTTRVLCRVPVSPKQHVLLLQVGRRIVVVADNGSQLNPLAQIDEADEVAMLIGQISAERTGAAAASFGSWFGRAREKFDEPATESHEAMQPSGDSTDDIDDSQVESARGELSGLMDKVRLLSQQFRRT